MKQVGLSYFTDSHLTLIALMLFFISFVFLIYRVYFFERAEKILELSMIPLKDEEGEDV